MERLQKLLSAAGVCSRRKAEEYLLAGRVTVNGETAGLGDRADAERDTICLDGQPIARTAERVYLMLHKPKGYITSLSDEKNRPTVAELVADCGVRVYPVGRLDYDSEGLLLMTNDGDFALRASHPRYETDKTYEVEVCGAWDGTAEGLRRLRSIGGERIRPPDVKLLWQRGERAKYAITIHEGKNRQVRRMCAAVGLQVLRLVRVREHTLCLGDLPAGHWRWLTPQERESFSALAEGIK